MESGIEFLFSYRDVQFIKYHSKLVEKVEFNIFFLPLLRCEAKGQDVVKNNGVKNIITEICNL